MSISSELMGIILALLGIIGFVLKIQFHYEGKIKRVYERFDEYKKHVDEKFVMRDMCNVVHNNTAANFSSLEKRVEDGFKSIDEKITTLLQLVGKPDSPGG
jgi:hypothetical protein